MQFYLIDAIVNNEPKGNKLIEQWLQEGGEITKGMYPPSNVQGILRIYLNAALSDQLKHFVTIYYLIDVCSSQELVLYFLLNNNKVYIRIFVIFNCSILEWIQLLQIECVILLLNLMLIIKY